MAGAFRFSDQLIDRFTGKNLFAGFIAHHEALPSECVVPEPKRKRSKYL
jgi:hypothetical protein